MSGIQEGTLGLGSDVRMQASEYLETDNLKIFLNGRREDLKTNNVTGS